MRFLVSYFPANSVRVMALRGCGFQVGNQVYIGPRLLLSTMNSDNSCRLIIGDRVSIGPGVTLVLSSDANHSRLTALFPPVRGSITLNQDAWIGTGVIILPNVEIGECAAIAAGAVVNRDIPGYTLAGGIPAKEIRKLSI